jgi:hypothetical protein
MKAGDRFRPARGFERAASDRCNPRNQWSFLGFGSVGLCSLHLCGASFHKARFVSPKPQSITATSRTIMALSKTTQDVAILFVKTFGIC